MIAETSPRGNVDGVDGRGYTTRWDYDGLGWLNATTTPVTDNAVDDVVQTYTYDLAGNMVSETDGRG